MASNVTATTSGTYSLGAAAHYFITTTNALTIAMSTGAKWAVRLYLFGTDSVSFPAAWKNYNDTWDKAESGTNIVYIAPQGTNWGYTGESAGVLADANAGAFRVTFATGTAPTNIVLHADYAGPAVAGAALWDGGDGWWQPYSSRNLRISGKYVAFKGEWRTAAGTYDSMFYNSFTGSTYTATFAGSFSRAASAKASAYRRTFRGCNAVTSISANPLPKLTGACGASMYYETYRDMTRVAGALPTGFMDTSGLTGAPAANMFNAACESMSGVTSLPTGFMDPPDNVRCRGLDARDCNASRFWHVVLVDRPHDQFALI